MSASLSAVASFGVNCLDSLHMVVRMEVLMTIAIDGCVWIVAALLWRPGGSQHQTRVNTEDDSATQAKSERKGGSIPPLHTLLHIGTGNWLQWRSPFVPPRRSTICPGSR